MSTPKLPPRIKVIIGEEEDERQLFMSFGLLNELAALVGGPEAVPNMSFHPVVSVAALELMLAPRDKRGEIIRPGENDPPIVPLDLDPATAETLLDWASTHVLDFFVRRLAKSSALLASRAVDLAEVGSSLSSSANSAGKTQ